MLSSSSIRLARNRQLANEKIVSTQGKIKSLNTELHGLYELLNESSLVSLIPLEILVEIFLFATESEFAEGPTSKLPIPIIIGRVCRGWRKAAWGAPPIWKNLRVNLRPSLRWVTGLQAAIVKEWVQRSGNQPLNLVLYYHVPTQSREEVSALGIFQPLLDVSHRWRRFQIGGWGPGFYELQAKLQETQHHFTLLTEIAMFADEPKALQKYGWNFSSAPRLVDVSIYEPLRPVDCQLAWNEVVSFIGIVNLEASLFVLKEARETLESCSLDLATRPWLGPSAGAIGGVNCLPNLETLSIELQLEADSDTWDDRWVDLAPFFQQFEAPALTSLHLTLNGADFGRLLPSFKDLAYRSKFFLYDLNLAFPDIPEEDLVELLAALPTLTHFTLGSHRDQRLFSDRTISMLDPTSGRPIMECLPNLIRLEFTGSISFSPETLITMLQNRQTVAGVDYIDNIDIKYYNKNWAQEDPNAMREFYRQLDAKEGFLTDVDIVWTK